MTTINAPLRVGGHGGETMSFFDYMKSKKPVISVRNDGDGPYFARAVGCESYSWWYTIKKLKRWDNFARTDRHITLQYKKAVDLHRRTNLSLGPVSLDEAYKCQDVLDTYQIIIYSGTNASSLIFAGPKANPLKIVFFHYKDHFSAINPKLSSWTRKINVSSVKIYSVV